MAYSREEQEKIDKAKKFMTGRTIILGALLASYKILRAVFSPLGGTISILFGILQWDGIAFWMMAIYIAVILAYMFLVIGITAFVVNVDFEKEDGYFDRARGRGSMNMRHWLGTENERKKYSTMIAIEAATVIVIVMLGVDWIAAIFSGFWMGLAVIAQRNNRKHNPPYPPRV